MEQNNKNKFIGLTDPTLPLGLSSVTLEEQYAKLTDHEKLLVAAKCLGMDHIPVSISQFIHDDFFLGCDELFNHGKAVFKYWLDKLDEIFPTPVTTRFPYISFGGCVGAGKSTVSKIIALYHLHRLDCCIDMHKSLGLAGGVPIAFAYLHPNIDTAIKDFKGYNTFAFEVSPYFRNNQYHNATKKVRQIPCGMQSTGPLIGAQIIVAVLSELGHTRPSDGVMMASEAITRYDSRFANLRHNFGAVIADSSAKDLPSIPIEHFEKSVPQKDLIKFSQAQWEVRPELFAESEGKTFKVYKGDAIQGPRIIEDDEDPVKLGIDLDRVIEVPISAKPKFMADIVKNLRDLAGCSYSGNEKFFNGDISHVIGCSSLKNYAPEEVIVDFYDKTDRIFDHVCNMIYRIPRGTNIFLHYDIGLRKDKTGVALCYFDGEDEYGNPKFRYPLLFVVSRKKGQSTSLDHLYQFIRDLVDKGYQVTFSADSFASAGIFQSCERDNVDYQAISMDKTMNAFTEFKNAINSNRVTMPYVNILLRECSELLITYNGKNGEHCKVDHPETSSCTDFDYAGKTGAQPGTKDLVDAAAGAMYSCLLKYGKYLEGGFSAGIKKTMSAIDKVTKDPREQSQKRFQSMLEDIF